MFGDPWTTSGGKTWFPCLCKIEIEGNGTNQTKGKNGNDKVVGMKVRCQVIKNRMGYPPREMILKFTLIEELIIMVRGWEL